MSRPKADSGKIREVISILEAEGKPLSVTAIRERLGCGSYSTIGAVLKAWRREQADLAVPEGVAVPERVTHLVQQLWAEAYKAAADAHEAEREKFQREHTEHERLKAEMSQEIARLEAELSRVEAEREGARADLVKAKEELADERVERARAEATIGTLTAELTELRGESRKALDAVTAWVERASRAEARLEELAKGGGERRS